LTSFSPSPTLLDPGGMPSVRLYKRVHAFVIPYRLHSEGDIEIIRQPSPGKSANNQVFPVTGGRQKGDIRSYHVFENAVLECLRLSKVESDVRTEYDCDCEGGRCHVEGRGIEAT